MHFFSKIKKISALLVFFIFVTFSGEALAEDIMQDVWSKLILQADRIVEFTHEGDLQFTLRAYLYRMAGNRIIDHFRSTRRLRELGDDEGILETKIQKTSTNTAAIYNRQLRQVKHSRLHELRAA